MTQLAASGFPYPDVRFEEVHSHGFFVADHLSVLEDTPGAQQAYWARADRFFAPLAQTAQSPELRLRHAGVAELADAPGLGPGGLRALGGSIPLARMVLREDR